MYDSLDVDLCCNPPGTAVGIAPKFCERHRVSTNYVAMQILDPVVYAAVAAIPAELLDILRLEFYSDPSQAAFKGVVGA